MSELRNLTKQLANLTAQITASVEREAERVGTEDARLKRRTERLAKREDAFLALIDKLEADAKLAEHEADNGERTDTERTYGIAEGLRRAVRRIQEIG